MEIICKLFVPICSILGGTGICYLALVALKWHIANLICKNPKLDNTKAYMLTDWLLNNHLIIQP